MSVHEREQRALQAIHTYRVRMTKVDIGPHVYCAEVEIDGAPYCKIMQRRGGDYEAYTYRGRLIASAPRLSMLREKLIERYAWEVALT